jgi:hypothetical protein
MKTVEFIETADANRQIHVTIPVDEPSARYRLQVSIERDSDDAQSSDDDWPQGFFERTAGKWTGELVRQPQGDYEKRAKL